MANWYPSHSRYKSNSGNYLWIYIHPRKLSYESILKNYQNRNIVNAKEDTNLEKFYFLAPQELQDNITHEWEPLENIMSKISSKVAAARESLAMGKERHKVDTPLVYNDSNRREVTFVVNLGMYNDPYKDVMKPIELLREYSSPSLYGTTIWETKIKMPNVFKVVTTLGNGTVVPLINMRHAALTAVQPSYKGPYIYGYPSQCELTLTFKDMEPLSKRTFEKISINGRTLPTNIG